MLALVIGLCAQPALAKDEVALYGSARQETFKVPNKNVFTRKPVSFNVHILPWREA